MYLQGDLQLMFDALYNLGVIDPVLQRNWTEALEKMDSYLDEYLKVISVANNHQNDLPALMLELKKFDQQTLEYLAMEVAKEFADYHSREGLH